MKQLTILSLVMFVLTIPNAVLGQDFVYRPVNPAFGGNPYNYQWLLSSAQEQNDFKEETDLSLFNQDPLADFQNDLNRQILSQLSRRLVTDTFGEEGLEDGTFELGGYQIDINSYTDGVHIDILDVNNGQETSIIVPYF